MSESLSSFAPGASIVGSLTESKSFAPDCIQHASSASDVAVALRGFDDYNAVAIACHLREVKEADIRIMLAQGPEASWLKYEARLNDYIYRFLYLEQKLRGRKLSAAAEYYKEQLQKSGEKLKEVKGEGDHTTSSDEFRTFETHCFEYFASCLDGIQTTKGNVAFRSLRQKIAELNRLNMYLLTVLVDAMQHLPLEEGPFQIPKETEIIDQFGDE